MSDTPAPVVVKPGTLPSPLNPQEMPVALPTAADDEEIDDDDLEETLSERLWGLTEMFPEGVRNATSSAANFSWQSTKLLYSVGRVVFWVAASSATILALPVMFETERAQMEEQQIQQQRQILLGPNAAVSGGGSGLMPAALPQVGPPPVASR